MSRLREIRNPEEQGASAGPTQIKTPENSHPLRCWACGQLYFVNDTINRAAQRAAEIDPSENAFCCDNCSDGYEAERRG